MNAAISQPRPMFWVFFCFFQFGLFAANGQEQEIRLSGKDPGYAGQDLVFFQYADPISKQVLPVCSARVAQNGSFECRAQLNQTTSLFLHIGIYEANLIAEPGKHYDLVFPPLMWPQKTDSLNPYYQKTFFRFVTRTSDSLELNATLNRFDDRYDDLVLQFAQSMVHRKISRHTNDSIVNALEAEFSYFAHPFFRDYVLFRLGVLRHMGPFRSIPKMVETHFANQPVRLQNPAYWELFDQVFSGLFENQHNLEGASEFPIILSSYKSYRRLSQSIRETLSPNLSDSMVDLIILKNLNDLLFTNIYRSKDLLQVLDSLTEQSPVPFSREIGLRIRQVSTALMPGFPPPETHLLDGSQNPVPLSDFKGKFLLLAFTASWSQTALLDLSLLASLQKQFSDHLDIILISPQSDYAALQEQLRQQNLEIMHYFVPRNGETLQTYRIKAFPAYFLVDPFGVFVASPAPGPQENFHSFFAGVLRRRN